MIVIVGYFCEGGLVKNLIIETQQGLLDVVRA